MFSHLNVNTIIRVILIVMTDVVVSLQIALIPLRACPGCVSFAFLLFLHPLFNSLIYLSDCDSIRTNDFSGYHPSTCLLYTIMSYKAIILKNDWGLLSNLSLLVMT